MITMLIIVLTQLSADFTDDTSGRGGFVEKPFLI